VNALPFQAQIFQNLRTLAETTPQSGQFKNPFRSSATVRRVILKGSRINSR